MGDLVSLTSAVPRGWGTDWGKFGRNGRGAGGNGGSRQVFQRFAAVGDQDNGATARPARFLPGLPSSFCTWSLLALHGGPCLSWPLWLPPYVSITGVSSDQISARLFTCLPPEDTDPLLGVVRGGEATSGMPLHPHLEPDEEKVILVCGCDTESLWPRLQTASELRSLW